MQGNSLSAIQQANAAITATGVNSGVQGQLSEKALIGYDTALYKVGTKLELKKLFSQNKGAKLPVAFQNLQFPNSAGIVIEAIQAVPVISFDQTVNGETAASANEAFFNFILNARVVIVKQDTQVFATPLYNILPYSVAYNPVSDTLSFFNKATAFTRLPEPIDVGTGDAAVDIVPPEGVVLTTGAAVATNPHVSPALDNSVVAASTGRAYYVKVFLAYKSTTHAQLV